MQTVTIRRWTTIHKWSSIVPTLFLLMLCVTGLPLIFHDEIDAALGGDREGSLVGPPSARAGASLDGIVAAALDQRPGAVPLFIGFSQTSPLITVTIGPSPDAPGDAMTLLSFDRSTGRPLGAIDDDGVMHFLLRLHTDMFLGLPGMLLLGAMGLLFLVALVSGAILYAPFMRRLRFGTVRAARSARVRRLDQHNLIGIVILAWAVVVGATGAINAFADPLTQRWREGEVARMTARYAGEPALAPADYGSIDAAMRAADAALPGRSPQFIGFPGGAWSSGHHYAIFYQGATPLTQYLLTPALVDASAGTLTDARDMPAVNQALMLSKPLHFGDYGGLPLKILWALLTCATIHVLGTGVLLWLRRGAGHVEARIADHSAGQPA